MQEDDNMCMRQWEEEMKTSSRLDSKALHCLSMEAKKKTQTTTTKQTKKPTNQPENNSENP